MMITVYFICLSVLLFFNKRIGDINKKIDIEIEKYYNNIKK